MKKRIFTHLLAALAMLPLALGAQTQTENHVVSKTYKVESVTQLTTKNPDSVATAIQYFDGLGRAKQSVLMKGGKAGYGNNALPYDWSLGQLSNSGFYNFLGLSNENEIISGTTPFGDTNLIWECSDTNGGNGSGWTSDYLAIDHTKAYRYTTWVKRSVNLTSGLVCHGPYDVDNLDGTANSNPYFWLGDLPQLDTWYLLVGYIHPSDYTGADIGISGVYDMQGNKVIDGTEFKWDASTTQARFRNYMFHVTDSSTRQYFWSPLLQKIDGTQDPLSDVLTAATVYNNAEIKSRDIITHFEYDAYGRQVQEFLPYASGYDDGRINSGAKLATQTYYQSKHAGDFTGVTNTADINAFSDKVLENSPLGRIFEQTAPGKDWKATTTKVTDQGYSTGHTIKFNYLTNGANEVRHYSVTTILNGDIYTPSLVASGFYSPGELTKTVTKDENWTSLDGVNRTTEEFKNALGQTILRRHYTDVDLNADGDTSDTGESEVAHDTYYVYNNFGNLSYVIPPKVDTSDGVSAVELNSLCYRYRYDTRNRLIEKKIPGKGEEYIIYDKLDRPLLTQDANQRVNNKWLFTKYDPLGRVAYTGETVNTRNRASMQSHVNNANNMPEEQYELQLTTTSSLGIYYRNYYFPTTGTVFTVNYYDTYVDLPTGFTAPTSVYGQTVTTHTKGLATVSKTRVLNPSAGSEQVDYWITTITYYDDLARPIFVYSKNDFLGTEDIVASKLDFPGKVLETKTTHKKTGKPDVVTIDRFEYDHQDRLISQTQKVNNQLPERIVRNNYDELGQLESKLTGNGTQGGLTNVTSGMSMSGNTISKTSGTCWHVGAATIGSIQADGYIEYEAGTTTFFMVGLSDTDVNALWTTIDYAIYNEGTSIVVYENAQNRGYFGQYQVGDIFRVERQGEKILYKQNGKVFYVSQVPSTGSLLGDISICGDNTQIKDLRLVDNSKGLQNVDYTYNVRGWLKTINEDAQSDNDLFNFTLRYNDPTSGTALFNGNIAQTAWSTASTNTTSNPVSNLYTYSYDALNRILSGIDNTGNYNLTSVSYDKNGNITNLQRKGHVNPGATSFGVMDDLTYSYDSGNKLMKVDDSATNDQFGFKDDVVNQTLDTVDDYTYDANGNMLTDANKGITNITYNYLNLPTAVTINGSTINYIYDASGIKLRKVVGSTTTDYAGNYIYENNTLQFFSHSEGYVSPELVSGSIVGWDYIYQYKDHLGNVRLTYADSNNDGTITASTEIIEESNYYPFGLKHKGYNNVVSSNGNSTAQKFKYNNIEYEESLGLNLYEMDLRQYDPSIARWIAIDPVTHHSASTYNVFDNNPVFFSDPSGADSFSFVMDIFSRSSSGEKWKNNNDGTFSSNKGQTTECDDCKYEIFNAIFIEGKLRVRRPTKDDTYQDIIGYGYDPQDQYELHIHALYDAINALEDDKLKLKLLKKLGIVGKKASKIIKFLSSKKYDAISTLIGLSTNNDFLANAPFPLGTMVDILDDPIQQLNREADYMVMWDNAMGGLNSLFGIEDFNNIVIIYSNELLTTSSAISSDDSKIIDSPRTATKWKYANVATQIGNNVYIFKTYELKD